MKTCNRTSISKLSTTLLCSLYLPFCFSAVADDGVSGEEASGFIESKSYEGSEDMPDGIAFSFVAPLIVEPEDRAGVNVASYAEDGVTEGVDFVTTFVDIDEAAAGSLIEGIAPSARALLRESQLAVRETVCVPTLSSWDNEKAISVKNQLGDIRAAIYEQHVIRAMIALDPEEQENFQKLLRAIKLSSSHGRIDYSQAYKDNPEGAKANLLSFCNM